MLFALMHILMQVFVKMHGAVLTMQIFVKTSRVQSIHASFALMPLVTIATRVPHKHAALSLK